MITIINLQLPQMITIITLLCSRKTTMASTSTPLLSQTQDIASLVIGCGYHHDNCHPDNNHPDDDDDDDDDDGDDDDDDDDAIHYDDDHHEQDDHNCDQEHFL